MPRMNWDLANLRERCRKQRTQNYLVDASGDGGIGQQTDLGPREKPTRAKTSDSSPRETISGKASEKCDVGDDAHKRSLDKYAMSCGAREGHGKLWPECPPTLHAMRDKSARRFRHTVRSHPKFVLARRAATKQWRSVQKKALAERRRAALVARRRASAELIQFLRGCARADFRGTARPPPPKSITQTLGEQGLLNLVTHIAQNKHYRKAHELARLYADKVQRGLA